MLQQWRAIMLQQWRAIMLQQWRRCEIHECCSGFSKSAISIALKFPTALTLVNFGPKLAAVFGL
jgi:hypothetical protein